MQVLTINIDGITYTMPPLKAKTWRKTNNIIQKTSNSTESNDEIYEIALHTIAEAFQNPKITYEYLDENLEADQIFPTFRAIVEIVSDTVAAALAKLPNVQAPE